MMNMNLGQKIAPPRFVMFMIVLVAATALLIGPLGPARGAMAGFDIAALLFMAAIAPLLRSEADDMRQHAKDNDANRVVLLGLTGVVMLVILVAVASEMGGAKKEPLATALIVATLALAWLFSNIIYALHYAHMFYSDDDQGKDSGGIDIPGCDVPDYWDFIYFGFTLGMTFQTSDVDIKSARIRRITIGHCLAAFVFNIGVLAFSINVLGN